MRMNLPLFKFGSVDLLIEESHTITFLIEESIQTLELRKFVTLLQNKWKKEANEKIFNETQI